MHKAISLISGTTFFKKNFEFGPCVMSKIPFASAIKALASDSFPKNQDSFAIRSSDRPRAGFPSDRYNLQVQHES